MLKDLKITKKFPLVMIIFALISALVTGLIAYSNASSEMENVAKDKLFSLLESRKSSLENYFYTIEQDLGFHAQSPLVVEAIESFSAAWELLPENKKDFLQNIYIHKNPYTIEQKDALLSSNDDSHYSDQHIIYHPAFRNLISSRSYRDLFLFDQNGNLIYSVIKEKDFASNMFTGQWQNTHLAQVFKTINEKPERGKYVFADFAPYEPSNNTPASFIASPIYDQEASYIGVLVFQMPIDRLNKVMQVTAGMGESGETYLVGSDLLMRSDSRFYKGRSILATTVNTPSVHSALKGESGVSVINDYRDIPVFSAYSPMNFLSTNWAVIAEVDKSEILQSVYTMSNFLLISGFIIAVIICFLGYIIASDISHPIVAMTDIMNKLAKNELNANISVTERKDEVGGMAKAMIVFKKNAIEKEKLQQKLSRMTQYDMLTGLRSRSYAMEHLDRLFDKSKAENKNLIVMFIDLDNFKTVNDTMGHHVGDELLKTVATRFATCVREEDVVARMGGDEFIVILSDINDREDINRIAENILEAMNTKFAALNVNCDVTASVGIAVYPQHADAPSALIKQADRAMYNAKENGKNNYSYPESH